MTLTTHWVIRMIEKKLSKFYRESIAHDSELDHLEKKFENQNIASLDNLKHSTVKLLSRQHAENYSALVIDLDDNFAHVAMSNPLDNDAIDNMTMQLQLPIKTYQLTMKI